MAVNVGCGWCYYIAEATLRAPGQQTIQQFVSKAHKAGSGFFSCALVTMLAERAQHPPTLMLSGGRPLLSSSSRAPESSSSGSNKYQSVLPEASQTANTQEYLTHCAA